VPRRDMPRPYRDKKGGYQNKRVNDVLAELYAAHERQRQMARADQKMHNRHIRLAAEAAAVGVPMDVDHDEL